MDEQKESMNYKLLVKLIASWKITLRAMECILDLVKHCEKCNTSFDAHRGELDETYYELMILKHEKHECQHTHPLEYYKLADGTKMCNICHLPINRVLDMWLRGAREVGNDPTNR